MPLQAISSVFPCSIAPSAVENIRKFCCSGFVAMALMFLRVRGIPNKPVLFQHATGVLTAGIPINGEFREFRECSVISLSVSNHPSESPVAVLKDRQESFFLQLDDRLYEIAIVAELRVGVSHDVGYGIGDISEERLVHAEPAGVTDGTSHEPPQNVAPPIIGGNNAVGNEERRASPVLGDDAHRLPHFGALFGVVTGDRLDLANEWQEQVCPVDVLGVLKDDHQPFEAHSRVDSGLRQGREAAIRVSVELHEHEVPQLHVSLADHPGVRVHVLAVGTTVVEAAAGTGVSEIVVELGARPARALISMNGRPPPVVRIAESIDAFRRDAVLLPEVVGLVVTIVHRCGEILPRQTHGGFEAVDRELHGAVLKVVAEAEVSQHLEHRQVSRVAHLVDVDGAEGLLRRSQPAIRRGCLAREIRLELHHARVGEQQGRVAHRDE